MKGSPPARGGCWPDPAQLSLLRAALLDGDAALRAWRAWQSASDIEALDLGSTRLLPLLRWNLERLGVRDPDMARYASVSRHYWVHNQLLFREASRLLRVFGEHEVTTLLLKGADLGHRFYPRPSTRPLDDFDVLVPPQRFLEAVEILRREGYRPLFWRDNSAPIPPDYWTLSSAHDFRKENAGQSFGFDLHHALFGASSEEVSASLWRDSQPFLWRELPARVLSPEDALLHVCAHGARWNSVPPIRWLADATLILRSTPGFNWPHLVDRTRQTGLAVPLRRALRFLSNAELDVVIPSEVLRELSALATTRAQRREETLLLLPPSTRSLEARLWLRARSYARWSRTLSPWKRPFSFTRYWRLSWGFGSSRQALTHGLRRVRELHS